VFQKVVPKQDVTKKDW